MKQVKNKLPGGAALIQACVASLPLGQEIVPAQGPFLSPQ